MVTLQQLKEWASMVTEIQGDLIDNQSAAHKKAVGFDPINELYVLGNEIDTAIKKIERRHR
jgi:hypothetical protein